jgi:futalosine hydrolase
MRCLYCAATLRELRGIFPFLPAQSPVDGYWTLGEDAFAVTGVGQMATALFLSRILFALRPQVVVNTGIAGAYPGSDLALGQVFWVRQEIRTDFGAEDGDKLLSPEELGWQVGSVYHFSNPMDLDVWEPAQLEQIQSLGKGQVGATVERCAGSVLRAQERQARGCTVESMEGAAVAAVCAEWALECVQIRAVSNVAGPRDFGSWQMDLALENLSTLFALG